MPLVVTDGARVSNLQQPIWTTGACASGHGQGSQEFIEMSDLVVLDFTGVGTANEVLTKLRSMPKENL
jgi:hypothetical protein